MRSSTKHLLMKHLTFQLDSDYLRLCCSGIFTVNFKHKIYNSGFIYNFEHRLL